MCMNYNETSQWAADLGSGYSSIRPLGEGGMGTLYRAHKDSLDVDVVIKRVKQKFKGRMDERAEANILKTLKHKYLPRIYDVIESPSGCLYYHGHDTGREHAKLRQNARPGQSEACIPVGLPAL